MTVLPAWPLPRSPAPVLGFAIQQHSSVIARPRTPLLNARYQRLKAAREALFERPLCLAVMCLLDTVALRCPSREQIPKLALALGRSQSAMRACLRTLLTGGVIGVVDGRYQLTGSFTIDTRSDPENERSARAYWSRVALERLSAPAPADLCSYNVFSIGRADYEKLQQLQREFLPRRARSHRRLGADRDRGGPGGSFARVDAGMKSASATPTVRGWSAGRRAAARMRQSCPSLGSAVRLCAEERFAWSVSRSAPVQAAQISDFDAFGHEFELHMQARDGRLNRFTLRGTTRNAGTA